MEALADMLYQRWQSAQETGDFAQGDRLYRKLREMNAADGDLSVVMGLWYRQWGQYDEALEAFAHGLLLAHERNSEILFETANTYFEMGDWQQAAVLYQRVTAMQPDYVEALFEYGSLLAQANQRELAREQFCQVIVHSENIVEHQIAAVVELSALGFGDEGIEVLHRALIRFGDNFFVYSNLGVEYAQLGEFDEAIFCHQKALEMNHFNGDLWYNLACTYALSEDFAKSLWALGKAIYLDGSNKDYALEDEELAALRQDMGFWRLLAQFEGVGK